MSIQNVNIGVRAIILDNHRVLMVKHLEGDKEFYVFPGGGLENNESIAEAAKREVSKETQINVKGKKIIYFREFVGESKYGAEFYVLCEALDHTDIKLGVDPEKSDNEKVLIAVEWVNIDKLSEITWYPEELKQRFKSDVLTGFKEFDHLGVIKI
mgnify:CR=1 FL=1